MMKNLGQLLKNYIQKKIMSLKAKSKIIEFDAKKVKNFLIKISNDYFLNETNVENLSFVLEITCKHSIYDARSSFRHDRRISNSYVVEHRD